MHLFAFSVTQILNNMTKLYEIMKKYLKWINLEVRIQ